MLPTAPTSSPVPTFADIALPLAAKGWKVLPVEQGQKRCTLVGWPAKATSDATTITAWGNESPYRNVAVMADENLCILDADAAGLIERIERETGVPCPHTFTVRSGGKGLPHVYFRPTDKSRAVGNCHGPDLFDFKSERSYVVGPGSRLGANGTTKQYEITGNAELAPIPDAWVDWLKNHGEREKSRTTSGPKVDPSFGMDQFFDLMEHYGITGDLEGDWFITDVCPIAGYKHEQSNKTGFVFDGEHLGFHCFAASCPGNSMSVGEVLKHLNSPKDGKLVKPYAGVIWSKLDEKTKEPNGNVDPDSWRTLFHTYDETLNAPPLKFAISGFLQEDGITFLGGPAGHGKTLIMLSMVRALLTGAPLFGYGGFPVARKSERVIYLVPESGLGPFVHRLKAFHLLEYVREGRLFYRTLSAREQMSSLADPRILKAAEGADVFLDTAVRFMEGDENSAADHRGFAETLFAVLKAGGRTVTGAHHSPKGFENRDAITLENALRGSGDIGAMLSTAWAIRQSDDKTTRVYVKNVKPRDFEPCLPFEIEGRPHIDQTGDFKMVSLPGAATAPKASSKVEKVSKQNKPEVTAARALRGAGKTLAEIAKTLHVTTRTIENWSSWGWLKGVESISSEGAL